MFCNFSGPQTVLQVKTVIVEVKQVLVMPKLKLEQKRGNPESLVEQVISKTQTFGFCFYCFFVLFLLFCPKLRIMDGIKCFACHLIITFFSVNLLFVEALC